MAITHQSITLSPKSRGFHIITSEVLAHIKGLPVEGIFHLYCQHTSCGLTINENADPDVLHDFELYFNKIVPETMKGMKHTIEGPDDMPAHIKAALVGSSISVPISNGRLQLGTWQGIYLCEFRNHPRSRTVIATIYS